MVCEMLTAQTSITRAGDARYARRARTPHGCPQLGSYQLEHCRNGPVVVAVGNANLIDGRNTIHSPIESGGDPPYRVGIYAVSGDRAIFGSPLFKDSAKQDYTLRCGSPAAVGHVAAGAYAPGSRSNLWWKRDFPPEAKRTGFDRSEQGEVC